MSGLPDRFDARGPVGRTLRDLVAAQKGGDSGTGSHLSEKFGAQGRTGQRGEDYFDKALTRAGLDQFERFRSLSIPDVPGRASSQGDIDCVLANANKVVLIDVKRWAAAGFYWSIFGLFPLKNLTPIRKDGEWRLSENMSMALERMRHHLPSAEVSAMVVFVPTQDDDPSSVPLSVTLLLWPGRIRSYLSGDSVLFAGAFTELYRRLGTEVVPPPVTILHKLARLKRQS